MAINPLKFETPEAYSSFDFTPLANLGKQMQQQQQQKMLANLGQQYGQPDTTGSDVTDPLARTTSAYGPPGAFSAPQSSEDVSRAIARTAGNAGMDPASWAAIASIESSHNPNSNYDKSTQYKGLFQIGSDEWKSHGGGGNIYDAGSNATAAAALAAENNAKFKAAFGRAPTPIETYMMHQQGFGFYKNGTMTNIAGNPYPGMSGPQTPETFQAGWEREFNRRKKFYDRQYAGEME
jgi:hypothetical protein